MSIRKELLKALKDEFGLIVWADDVEANKKMELVLALWAARWMAERCAKEIESRKEWTNHDIFCETPRQLAQELSR